MRNINSHRARPSEQTGATAKRKRKRHFDDAHHHHKTPKKKQKSVSKTTLTIKPYYSHQNFPTFSNKFQAIQSSPSRKRNSKHSTSRNSSTLVCNRKWVFSSHDSSAYKDKVVVVSYNILGVENASKHPNLYFKVPSEFLDWDWRKELIYKEMNHYNAGIICFQEVDRFNDLNDLLQRDGFRGVYKARTGEADDGCAIFWKDKLFTLLHEENIEFQSFGLRNNVAQLCVLKMKKNPTESDLCMQASRTTPTQSQSLVVGNIHVLFNPNRGDIKLGQIRLFLEKVHKLSQEWGRIPVILGGDLNSIPQSAIYQFLASSELNVLLHDRRNISGQLELEHPPQHKEFKSQIENVARPLMYGWSDEELRLATGSEEVTHLQHQLKLCSAYLGVPGSHNARDNSGEPLATSYHSKFMGTVDYIWHTKELIPVRVLETLPINVLRRSGGFPNERWGSDHLALACELAFADHRIRT